MSTALSLRSPRPSYSLREGFSSSLQNSSWEKFAVGSSFVSRPGPPDWSCGFSSFHGYAVTGSEDILAVMWMFLLRAKGKVCVRRVKEVQIVENLYLPSLTAIVSTSWSYTPIDAFY